MAHAQAIALINAHIRRQGEVLGGLRSQITDLETLAAGIEKEIDALVASRKKLGGEDEREL